MKLYIKHFTDTPHETIRREARFQRRAAAVGLSPPIVKVTETSIVMENLDQGCLAEVYGDSIEDIPEWIKEDILDILYTLRTVAHIDYIDVSPYNFIEKDGVVWIIDFGHATQSGSVIDPYLDEVFAAWSLSKWNPDFL